MVQPTELTVEDADGVKYQVPTLAAVVERLPAALGPATKAGSLAVALASNHDAIKVDQLSSAYSSSVTITRPADTTAYTAGDVVGGVLSIASIGPNGGTIIVNGLSLELDISAIPLGMTSFRLYLYSVTPPSALADNAPFDLPAGDRAGFLGFIDIDAPADLGSTCFVQIDNLAKQLKLSGSGLFGYLVTSTGYTPGSATVYKLSVAAMAV